MKKFAEWSLYDMWDRTGIQRYLERMAEKGWMLERVGLLFHYRRCTPGKVRFCVTYYPDADLSDPAPTEGEQEYQALVSYSGWKLVAANGQMQIFCAEREDLVPIETDPVLAVGNIHRAMQPILSEQRRQGIGCLALVALYLVYLLIQPTIFWAISVALLGFLLFSVRGISYGVSCIAYSRWHRRALQAADNGDFLDTPNLAPVKLALRLVLLAGALLYVASVCTERSDAMLHTISLLSLIIIPGAALGTAAVWKCMKRKGVSKETNKAVLRLGPVFLGFLAIPLILALLLGGAFKNSRGFDGTQQLDSYQWQGERQYLYHDAIPLRVEDLQPEVTCESYITELSGMDSLFLGTYHAEQHPRWDDPNAESIPTLQYNMVAVKWKALWNTCYNDMLRDFQKGAFEPTACDPAPWGAVQAWGRADGSYLLGYEDGIVLLRLGYEPTETQMQTVGAVFGK